MSNVLEGVKVGDKLLVKYGHINKGSIQVVERVTPTGRVITKHSQFNPDGHRRGDSGWSRAYARPATEDDIAGVCRLMLVSKLERFRRWENLSAEDLKLVGEIVAKHDKS